MIMMVIFEIFEADKSVAQLADRVKLTLTVICDEDTAAYTRLEENMCKFGKDGLLNFQKIHDVT